MSASHRRFLAALILAWGLFAVCTATASDAPKEKQPRLDLFGDPLPPGAVVRLGTMRLRYAACMAFSPDGKIVATAQHHTVHLWDAATGKHLRRLTAPHFTELAHTVAFSPDGRKVAILDNLGIDIVVWQVDKERPLFTRHITRLNGVHQLVTARIVFSPDSKTLYTGNDQTVHAWDATTGKETYRFQHGKPNETRTNTIVFSRDGKLFATASDAEPMVRLWDTHAGKLLHVLHGHRWGVLCAAFSPDGALLATGGAKMHLWDVKSGKEICKFGANFFAAAFTPDGKDRGHEQPVFGVAFSPDGKRLATASGDATTLIWDLAAVAARGPHPRVDKRSLKSPLDAKDLEAAWNDLAGNDAVKAQQAVWMFAREPRQAAAFLGQRLQPADKPESARIAALIDDLDSDQFATRERANAELSRLGTSAEPMLRKKRAEKVSLEMRKRIDLLLEKLDVLAPLSGEELRHIRAVEALEQAGTREARQLLRRLAEGAECARLTREAKASLQRLDRHSLPRP